MSGSTRVKIRLFGYSITWLVVFSFLFSSKQSDWFIPNIVVLVVLSIVMIATVVLERRRRPSAKREP